MLCLSDGQRDQSTANASAHEERDTKIALLANYPKSESLLSRTMVCQKVAEAILQIYTCFMSEVAGWISPLRDL